jgi:hypothetical protein
MADNIGSLKESMESAEHREASYQAQTFKQLSIAHSSSILVYNRSGAENNTKDLVRKFRPEFEQIFVFNDAKSCFSFIEEKNYDMDHQEISLVCYSYESFPVKNFDFIIHAKPHAYPIESI